MSIEKQDKVVKESFWKVIVHDLRVIKSQVKIKGTRWQPSKKVNKWICLASYWKQSV